MRRAGIALGVVASIVVGVAACGAPGAPVERSQASDEALRNLDDQEQAFLGLINQYRQSQGLAPLTATPLLNQVAYDHSNDMATNDYFDHNDKAGHSPFDRMKTAGYDGGYMAENIAAGNADAQSTFEQWRNSPGHDENMRGPHYVAIGIGRAYGSTAPYSWYWTTDFGNYVDDSVEDADAGD